MVENVKPRRYDASNRHRQAAATQARILAAAHELFIRDGYTATTMNAIADHAGVAVQTVYASTKSKRDILKRIIDLAVSGPDEQVAVATSTRWLEIEREPDARTQLKLFARLHRQICDREAPAFSIMADAAGSDREIRSLMHETAQLRYQDQMQLARSLERRGSLRDALSTARAADVIWTLANERTYLALVRDREWSTQDYEDWLTNQLMAALLPAHLPFMGVDGTEHPNALAYRRTADAFRSGNLTLLSSLIDADLVWHVPGRHAMAGDIHGRDALLAWFGLLRPKGFWLSEHDVFGNDDHVCALSVMGAVRDGVEVQTRVVSVFHYRDGRQLERWFYPEDPVAWDAIFEN